MVSQLINECSWPGKSGISSFKNVTTLELMRWLSVQKRLLGKLDDLSLDCQSAHKSWAQWHRHL